MGESIKKYKKTIIGDDQKLRKKQASPFFKSENYMEMENGESETIEITMAQNILNDDKPVAMAAAILSNSKLHFLKFIYEVVYHYFQPGAFKLSYCDTDSIAIGNFNLGFQELTISLAFTGTKEPFDGSRKANMASVLFPVIKPELLDEFVMIWDSWFVLEDTVSDEKCPGKLKSKSD